MRVLIFILLVLVVSGCIKESADSQLLVNGFFRADNDSVFVEIGRLQSDGVFVPTNNADARIMVGDSENSLTLTSDGRYHLSNELIGVGNELKLLVDNEVTSTSMLPPIIEPISVDNTNLTIDVNAPGVELFGLSWNQVEGHSFVIQLECLEENKVEIPFEVPHGLFDSQFNGPIEEASIDLYDVDFMYYGQHRLTVYIIDSKYAEVFFYRSRSKRNVITAGPDNVFGAHGFWACTRAFEVLLNVE